MTSATVTTNNPDFFDHAGFHPDLPIGSDLPRSAEVRDLDDEWASALCIALGVPVAFFSVVAALVAIF